MALLLKEDDVRSLLTMDACLAAVEEAFRLRAHGQAMVRPRTRMAMPDGTHQLMGGWVGGEINAFGLKSYGGPHKSGVRGGGMVVLLYDGETSALLAILEGNLLGQIRTGAASGVATRYMAREDASTVGIIGTGRQAATQLEAVCRVRDIQRVWAYSRKQERRDAFAEEMARRLDVPVTAVDTGEECVREADVVVTITASREPVLEGAWLREGTHVNAAGGNHYLRRELDDEAIRRAALITVDDLPQAQAESGELMAAAARGALQWERVREMADVVSGSISGRTDAQAITLFESQGIATWDVAAAMATYCAARERGVGVEIAL